MNVAPVFLLVEPSPILQPILKRWLENLLGNPRILIATNGADALRLATQESPSHVLIELNLPDGSGFEILHQLRQSLPASTVIATGWYESRWFLDKVRSAGADGFVSKDKLRSELLPLWKIPLEQRMEHGKTSAPADY